MKENRLLKLIPPVSFYLFNVPSRKFKITYVACILFLLDSTRIPTHLGFGISHEDNWSLCQQFSYLEEVTAKDGCS